METTEILSERLTGVKHRCFYCDDRVCGDADVETAEGIAVYVCGGCVKARDDFEEWAAADSRGLPRARQGRVPPCSAKWGRAPQ